MSGASRDRTGDLLLQSICSAETAMAGVGTENRGVVPMAGTHRAERMVT
jgi:hypothetical protein